MSKDLEFEDIIKELQAIHSAMPDIRFGRIIQEAIDSDKRLHNVNLFDISSKNLLSALKQYNIDQQTKRGL